MRPGLLSVGGAVAVAALILVVGFPLVGGSPTPVPTDPGRQGMGTSGTAVARSQAGSTVMGPTPGLAPIRNVMVDVPCNATSGNAEVVQAYDPVAAVLYEEWIGCGGIGFSRSIDGGYSFSPAVTVPGSNTGSSWDPSIALAPNGTVYAAYMVNNGSGDTPALAWSFDHGRTFAGNSSAFTPGSNTFSDRDYIAVAPNGTIYISWDYSPNATLDQIDCATAGGSCYFTAGDYNIVVVWSSDGGHRWSQPVPVEPEYPNAAAPAGPLLVEPNGTIALLYEDYPTYGPTHWLGLGRNYFVRSTDGGAHWSAPVPVENATFLNSTWWIDGSLARDSSGTLYASFDTQNATADTAYVALSRDDGATWSRSIQLNPDTDRAAHILVAVAGGQNGTAYLAWMANNSTLGWSTYAVTLFGNGSTLTAPTLVSSQFGVTGEWIGDTMGISDLGSGRVAVSWTYGVLQGTGSSSQVFAAVLGETPPVGAPRISTVVPGIGSVTLGWIPPTGAGNWVGGYLLVWGLIDQRNFFNTTLPGSATFTTVPNLPPFLDWYFQIAATNGAGEGPLSAAIYVDLTNWGVVKGSVTPSNATIRLDGALLASPSGSYLGNTTAGPHILDFSLRGYYEVFTTVILPWNGSIWFNASLTQIPATLEGWVKPVDATVQLDGAALVTNGGFYQVANLTGGRHVLTVSRTAFNTITQNITVYGNSTVWANVSLVAANGTLSIAVSPGTASVRVGGNLVPVGAGNWVNLSLFPGRYPVEVTASGYLPYFTNATIGSLMIYPLTVTLLPVPPPTGGNTTGGGPPVLPGYLLVTFAVVLVIGVIAAAFWLRRGRSEPESGSPPPSEGAIWEPDEAETEDSTSPGEESG
ncbi:MAG TPA: exo-alpha-sialidase [Thermoplasmata archaeon]|nr:exo-alpha-sialidase [Thermoplasmata archaeon]